MANVKFPRKEVEKHIKLSNENVDKIMMLGIPVESLTDEEIEIQVLPNRPDMLSLQGFLRVVNAALGRGHCLKEYDIQKSGAKIIVDKSVEKVRPYAMAAIVKGVKFDDEKIKEIMQWQEKIHTTVGRNRKKVALGYYDLNKIKFPVKYLAKAPKEIIFEPLDMQKKMDANRILSEHPRGREFGGQLSGFDKFPVYYDSSGEVLSLPPITNSNKSGKILPGTSDILIECSGSDLNTLKKVISLAVVDLIDLGGKAYSVDVIYGKKVEEIDLKPEPMKINLANVNKTLGLELKEKDLEKLLPKMGFGYRSGKVIVPAWRTDIIHEVDIIEDIGIAYGYENLKPEIPKVATIGEEAASNILQSKIAEILSGLGLLEVSSLHLIKQEEAKELPEKEKIEVTDSKTEYKFLRPNLMVPSLRILSENKDNEYPQKFFEIGVVFELDKNSETGVKEKNLLMATSSPGNFTEAKQSLDYLLRMLGLEAKITELNHKGLIEGRAGKVLVNGQEVGIIGEVHPQVLSNWKILVPVAVFELDIDKIKELL